MAGKKGGATMAAPKEQVKQNEKTKNLNEQNIRVRIDKLFNDESRSLRAFASANIGDFAVHGIAIYENNEGLWVNMPQNSYTVNGEKKYEDIFHPVTSDARKALCGAVVDAYQQALEQSQTAEVNQSETTEVPVQKM